MQAIPTDLADIEAANASFLDEVARYRLQFRCDSCAHVVRASGDCSMGYPNHFLKGEPPRAIMANGALAFCKYYELGEGPQAQPIGPSPQVGQNTAASPVSTITSS